MDSIKEEFQAFSLDLLREVTLNKSLIELETPWANRYAELVTLLREEGALEEALVEMFCRIVFRTEEVSKEVINKYVSLLKDPEMIKKYKGRING